MSAFGPEFSVSATPEIDGKFIGIASEDEVVGFFELGVTELSAMDRESSVSEKGTG
jgi:hypothetical protein